MPWINVVSERWADLAVLSYRESSDRLVRRDVCDLAFRLMRTGSPEHVLRWEQMIHESAESVLSDLKQPKDLGEYIASETTVGILILSTLLGKERADTLRNLLKIEGLANSEGKARISVLQRLFKPQKRRLPNKPISLFASNESNLYRRIETLTTAEALQLCNSPRGPVYGWTEGLILPLAFVLASERNVKLDLTSVSELLACGAYPERRGKLIFDCSVEPPKIPNVEDETDSTTWYPFSAVELKDGQLIAYWWVGFMRGKLAFSEREGQNAFWMLTPDRLERAWSLVKERIDKETWFSIEPTVKQNRVKYVTVVDTTLVEVEKSEVLRAANSYGIDIDVTHIFDV